MKTNKRNEHGVKNFGDQYRTINGHHYDCWYDGTVMIDFDGDPNDFLKVKKAELLSEGKKVRKIGNCLYVRID